MVEKKYEDAIAVLGEIILNQRRTLKQLDWQIDTLRAKILDLEKKIKAGKEETR